MDVVSYVIGYQSGLKKGSGQGVELPELTNPAGEAQIREGYEAIDANGAKIEGEMPTVEMYIDSLSFDKTNGKIIAGATVTGSGYVQQIRKTQNAGVSTLGATTIIPGAEDQVIEKHRWLTGDITVKGVALQEKTVTPGEADIVVTPGADYTGLSKVTVKAVAGGGGGGSMEGVHTVTFMSQDGTTELYKRSVLDRNDCAEPVSRGLIETPAPAEYYLKGWATSVNGVADENILKDITENKAVYAVIASETRDGGTFGSSSEFTWKLDVYGTLTVSGAGNMNVPLSSSSKVPWKNYRADIKRVVFSDGVTLVPRYGTQECTNLESVVIPDSVTSIGQNAFYGCSSIESIIIPNSVTTIGGSAFQKCSSLTNIAISDGVTRLNGSTFTGCSSLESITIPEGVTFIGNNVFDSCTSLASVNLPDSLTEFSNNVFGDCAALASITIPSGVNKMSTNVFLRCTALKSVVFADTSTWYIGSSAGAKTTKLDVTNPATNATYLTDTYRASYWTKA